MTSYRYISITASSTRDQDHEISHDMDPTQPEVPPTPKSPPQPQSSPLDECEPDMRPHTINPLMDVVASSDITTPATPSNKIVTLHVAPGAPHESSPPPPSRPFLGLFLVGLSAFLFSIMSLLVSLVSHDIPSIQITWIRSIIQFLIAHITLRVLSIQPWGSCEMRIWIMARGTVGMASFTCLYYALAHMELADATVLFFTTPVFAGIMARVILKERFDWMDALSALVSIGGVILVARPAFIFGSHTSVPTNTAQHTIAVGVALLGAVLSAVVYIFIRKIGSGTHPMILVQSLGLSGTVLLPFLFPVQTPTWNIPWFTWLKLVGIGIVAFCGQILFNAGVQREKAGPASMMRTLDVVFAFGWQISVQSETPSLYSFLGALLITSCCVVVGIRKYQHEKREKQQQQWMPVPDHEQEKHHEK